MAGHRRNTKVRLRSHFYGSAKKSCNRNGPNYLPWLNSGVKVMQHEHEQIQFEDLAEVLRSAQLRRSADLGKWFRDFFKKRRQEWPGTLYRPTNSIVHWIGGARPARPIL